MRRWRNTSTQSIIITDQKQRNSSQSVYSSDIQLIDVINSAAEYKALSDFEFGCNPANGLDSSVLHKATNILKSDIGTVKGIEIYPLNPQDISNEKAKSILPK